MSSRLVQSLLVAVLVLQLGIISFQIYSYFNPAIWYSASPALCDTDSDCEEKFPGTKVEL